MRRAEPGRARPVLLLAVLGVLALGWWLPGVLIGDGVERYRDPARYEAAAASVETVGGTCLSNPVGLVLVRAVRVTRVERVAGSCTVGPAPDSATADLRATVRVYGPFGVPVRTFTATCGGTYVAC